MNQTKSQCNTPTNSTATVNVGERLGETARRMPDDVAIVMPIGRRRNGRRQYKQISFCELDRDSNRVASGLRSMGVSSGMRIVLMVRPSIDFISLAFGLFKSGAVTVLIDPGMGRKNLIRCLSDVRPEGFIAIPVVHAIRTLLPNRFPAARHNVTVGRRWFWRGATIDDLRRMGNPRPAAVTTRADDPAAIIFTTGSTGPPKGVLYRHGNFDQQVDQIRNHYGIEPGERDLPGFPLFALFNCAMGVSTVIPDMDPTRPAQVDPRNIVEAVHDWDVTQAFGSPAIWNVVGRYCKERDIKLPSLRRILSAGAPVPVPVLRCMKNVIDPQGDMHTPYGATEALPVASIAASEVLSDTATGNRPGAGTCVGRRFPGIDWKVIRIEDGPIARIDLAEELQRGQIGELIVRGPVVTTEYVTRVDANPLSKIADGQTTWHRMGDVGYLDDQQRFWFCGRKAHRVVTAQGPLYTIPCEAIFNEHERVFRSALVGIGPIHNRRPVVVIESHPGQAPRTRRDRDQFIVQLRDLARGNELTQHIRDFLFHRALPVDIRHNAKIFREQLAFWAAGRLRNR